MKQLMAQQKQITFFDNFGFRNWYRTHQSEFDHGRKVITRMIITYKDLE